jgi:hypothetical protein
MSNIMDIVERIISVSTDSVIDEFTSILVLKNNLYITTEPIKLYRWDNILISGTMGLLVAKTSPEDIREFNNYCGSHLSDEEKQVEIPVLSDHLMGNLNPYLYNANILNFLASLAKRENTITIYYRFSDYGGGTAWAFDASIFDYREGKSAYTIFEYFDQGSLTMGQYAGNIKYSEFQVKIVNGYKGHINTPPFDIPLCRFIRDYLQYEGKSYQDSWKKLLP